MIQYYREKYPKVFFQEISEEGLFGAWNKEKTHFMFELRPEIFEKYALKEEHMYGYDYYGNFTKYLDKLQELGVIKDYERLYSYTYNKEEYKQYFEENKIYIGKNFFYSYEEEGGIYEIEYSLEKLSLFKKIIHEKNSNFSIKLRLYKNILFLYEKEKINGEIKGPKVFDIDVIYDEINLQDDTYHFNDFEVLLTGLCLHHDTKLVMNLLEYLSNNVSESERYIIDPEMLKYKDVFHIKNIGDKDNITKTEENNSSLEFQKPYLHYGENKSKQIKGYQLKFCESFFLNSCNEWGNIEEYIYGKGSTPPNTGLINIIKKINGELKSLGVNKYITYSDSDYVYLENEPQRTS